MHCSTSLHKVMMQKFQSHPSINVSPLIRNLVLVALGQPQCPKHSIPNINAFQLFLRVPKALPGLMGFLTPPRLIGSLLWGTFPARHAQMLSTEGVVVLIPEPLGLFGATGKWLYPMLCWSLLSFFFPRLNPKILQRDLNSAAGTCDLIFLVSTQTIWPWSTVGT